MPDPDLQFIYRLPATSVRIVGSVSTAQDTVIGSTAIQREAVVTTEYGADLLTEITIVIDNDSKSRQKTSWNLLSDGRLAGADVATTVDRYANWAPLLKVASFALAAAMPLLIPGPAGMLASVGALSAAAGLRGLRPVDDASDARDEAERGETPEQKRLAAYERAQGADAAILRRLRAAEKGAQEKFVAAVEDPGSEAIDRLRNAERALNITRAALARAEEKYVAWIDSKISRDKEDLDERLRVDELPSVDALEEWARSAEPGSANEWQKVALKLRTAVSVEILDPMDRQASVADPPSVYRPVPLHDSVMWRRPRMGEIEVWKLSPHGQVGDVLQLVETQRLHLAFPGNEATLPLESRDDTSRSVAVTFEADGALTKIGTDDTGVAQQRSADLTALFTGARDAATAGKDLRDALAPPSLEAQAAAAEAAAKLAPTPSDPQVDALKKRLAEEQLRARLRIAQQIAVADSPPVIVHFDAE